MPPKRISSKVKNRYYIELNFQTARNKSAWGSDKKNGGKIVSIEAAGGRTEKIKINKVRLQ